MGKKPIEKPIILAICGKSATGKTYLVKWLKRYFTSKGLPTHIIISATTRTPREKETVDDYYFMSDELFDKLKENKQFLEIAEFNNWRYGTLKREIHPGFINIGIFNVQGLLNLYINRLNYFIIPIYLEEKLSERLKRSWKREGKFKTEYLRRAMVDFIDFYKIKEILIGFYKFIDLSKATGVWEQSNIIYEKMIQWKVLKIDKSGRPHLNDVI